MKLSFKHAIILLIVLISAFQGVSATDTSNAYTYVAITSVSSDPQVFMYGDTGTITVSIKNTGTESVSINNAALYSKDLKVLNDDSYDTVGYIGAGNEMQFTFTVKADSPDGIYYPRFYLDFSGSSSLGYNIPVKIESTGLLVAVTDSPDTYQNGNEEKVVLNIGNPRENAVSGVTVSVEGTGVESKQTSYFIGNLDSDESSSVTFDVTPTYETEMNFVVTYRNGMNTHTSEISVPVVFGEDKMGANPVMNNIEIQNSGSYTTVSGDITNAGLEDAYSVVVTVGSPAVAVDPYKSYVIGSLEPDDFSGFDVTFTQAGSGSVPVVISYKDEDGNSFETIVTVDTVSQTAVSGASGAVPSGAASSGGGQRGGPMGGFGSGMSSIPVFEIIIVIIAGIGIFVAWRKGLLKKACDTGREKLDSMKKR